MKFSVIIPVFNAEKYLRECVNSVLNQTYKNFEIILVNDGSSDESGEICDNLLNRYPEKIKVFHHSNKGQLLTRCKGINEASGDYCVFLDSDDFIDEICLETLFETAQKYAMPDGIIYTFSLLYENGETKKSTVPLKDETVFQGENKSELYKLFIETSAINSMCTKALKRAVLLSGQEKFNEYSSLRCAEDRLQSLEAITNSQKIVFIDKPLYFYRQFSGSVTRNFTVSAADKFNIKMLCKEEEAYLKKWGLKSEPWQAKEEAIFLNHAMYTFTKFYNNMTDKSEKEKLIRYDWTSFVEPEYLKRVDSNPYVNNTYKTLWRYVINKKYFLIKIYFFRTNLHLKIRNIKRKDFS